MHTTRQQPERAGRTMTVWTSGQVYCAVAYVAATCLGMGVFIGLALRG